MKVTIASINSNRLFTHFLPLFIPSWSKSVLVYAPPLHNAPEIPARLKTGGERAFEEVYRSRYLAIFTFVMRLVTNQQAAEDTTTDTLL